MKSFIVAVVGFLGPVASATAQVPVAIVEDAQGKVEGAEFMDYVVPGKVIKLGPKATIVLGYMSSCWRETITGATVVVGAEQSMVHQGDVQRVKVDCGGSKIQLSDREAEQSAATAFRALKPRQRTATPPPPQLTLYGLSPIVEITGGDTLIVERLDARGERYTIPLRSNVLVRGRFYDFAKANVSLTAGGTYAASLGARTTIFKVDVRATSDSAPIIGRLLRFE